jgi:hypothetical protein
MKAEDLLALIKLQELPVILDDTGKSFVPELHRWSDDVDRTQYQRHVGNAIAHSGLSLEELHLFFARAGGSAAQSWNAQQSFFGRLGNLLTVSNVGYAEVPGRILKQGMEMLGDDPGQAVVPTATYLVRADVALEYRDRLKAMRDVHATG